MTYLKKFIGFNPLIQNSVQLNYLLELYPLPLYPPRCIPLLPKDGKIKWFWLIIAGSSPIYKEDKGYISV